MKVLFICTANLCRSPLAEGYLKFLKVRGSGFEVSSAGVAALVGLPPLDCAVEVAKQHGFDISDSRAKQLSPLMIRQVDEILCMETWHAQKVMELEAGAVRKVRLLGSYQAGAKRLVQIPDPREFKVPECRETFQMIKKSIEGFVNAHKRILSES